MPSRTRDEQRLLMVAASKRDQTHATRLFHEDSIETDSCRTVEELVDAIEVGAGAVLLSDAALRRDHILPFLDYLARQPPWSDLPVILVTSEERPGWFHKQGLLNVSILRQPVHLDTLLSVARSALKSRERQYQVRDLIAEQEETQQELRRMDRRKDEFLATVAHEIRNPISPIRSALDLMQLSGGSLENEPELIEIMNRQVRQLTRIVDDMLDVSRVAAGKLRLIQETIDLREPVWAGIESSRPFIEQSQQTLEVDLGKMPIYVTGDASRLVQCVVNLLNNAAKYTPEGGQITVTAKTASGMAALSVRDTGIGLASDQIDSVFELFQQHDVDRERGQAGMGIGLTLVQRLINLHGGLVEVHSDGIDKGAEFTIRLPTIARTHELNSRESRDKKPNKVSSFNILLVEDTRAIRILTQRLLEAMGHQVSVAEDGGEGLEKAIELIPDVVLSDVSMPRMDGLQLAKKLRADRKFDSTLLVALSGFGRSDDLQQALAAGFNRHLTKPVDAAMLAEMLAEFDQQRKDLGDNCF